MIKISHLVHVHMEECTKWNNRILSKLWIILRVVHQGVVNIYNLVLQVNLACDPMRNVQFTSKNDLQNLHVLRFIWLKLRK